ncbi:MAG: SH3 domain-containing protein [Christensenellales bacterium]
MKKILGLLVTAFMLTASALAADLDTPQIGAAVCAPEEADGSVVLHEAPDGRSETLMRYFQGAPLQVLDLADGWAHVRMGMTGESLEGYIFGGNG